MSAAAEATMDLNEIVVFAKVVETRSFTAAAQQLGLPKSTVSRKVAQLEERLGVRLLQRTTRKLNLTEVGQAYYERCARIVQDISAAEQVVTDMQTAPRGLLRITAPVDLGSTYLGAMVAEFLLQYPEIQIELDLADRVVDLIEEGFDLAIRAGTLADGSLIARRLMDSIPHFIVASPAYVERRGAPEEPGELAKHDCLVFSGHRDRGPWRFRRGARTVDVTVSGRAAMNDFDLIRQATLAGHGIARLPAPAACAELRAGNLVRLLEDWDTAEVPLSIVYPSTRHLSPKVRAFIDLTRQRMTPDTLVDGAAVN